MEELTYEECDILIDALDEWIEKGQTSEILGDIFTGIFEDEMPEGAREEMKQKRQHEKMQRQEQKRTRKKQAAKLKAKLYTIQDKAEVTNGI